MYTHRWRRKIIKRAILCGLHMCLLWWRPFPFFSSFPSGSFFSLKPSPCFILPLVRFSFFSRNCWRKHHGERCNSNQEVGYWILGCIMFGIPADFLTLLCLGYYLFFHRVILGHHCVHSSEGMAGTVDAGKNLNRPRINAKPSHRERHFGNEMQ